ncbi:hypothetical protein NDU88_007548 [Pleurodeles waltl]|uniref:Uncharacterized protein n=1 Tax=Pleurodeles waltl TaxID=8319 RepID=A0AAV7RV81_PLEWA|nr:hypothetical protein NDU88_007548 [Pleurodeles waltl]
MKLDTEMADLHGTDGELMSCGGAELRGATWADVLAPRTSKEGPFDVENGRVSMYPDYAAAVQAKRASYTEVKKILRTEGIRSALLFPLKLKIMWAGHTHFCLSPEEAWSWLETYRIGKDDQNLRDPLTG